MSNNNNNNNNFLVKKQALTVLFNVYVGDISIIFLNIACMELGHSKCTQMV